MMPLVLDTLTVHGSVRARVRDVPMPLVVPRLRKGDYKGGPDYRDPQCMLCDVVCRGRVYHLVVRLTKRVSGIQHCVLVTAYPLAA